MLLSFAWRKNVCEIHSECKEKCYIKLQEGKEEK